MVRPGQARLTQSLETTHRHQTVALRYHKEIKKIFIICCQVRKEEYYPDHWRWLWKPLRVKTVKEYGCHSMKFTTKKFMIFTIKKEQVLWILG